MGREKRSESRVPRLVLFDCILLANGVVHSISVLFPASTSAVVVVVVLRCCQRRRQDFKSAIILLLAASKVGAGLLPDEPAC